jgi:peroxiredoxin Q/BCP
MTDAIFEGRDQWGAKHVDVERSLRKPRGKDPGGKENDTDNAAADDQQWSEPPASASLKKAAHPKPMLIAPAEQQCNCCVEQSAMMPGVCQCSSDPLQPAADDGPDKRGMSRRVPRLERSGGHPSLHHAIQCDERKASMTTGPKQGDKAPDFELPTDGGGTISLSALAGKNVVLYFYPKDDTSGCTQEAIDFNRLKAAFASAHTEIIGISADSVASHEKFKTKHRLALTLASDERKTLLAAYGVWVEKSMYGRKYMGIERTTVLLDASGKIARIWTKVKVPGHAEEVLAAAKALPRC